MVSNTELERFIFHSRLTDICATRDPAERVKERLKTWKETYDSFRITEEQSTLLIRSERLRMLVLEGCVESALKFYSLHPSSVYGNLDCELLFLRFRTSEVEDFLHAESERLQLNAMITEWLDENIYLYGREEPPDPFEQLSNGRSLGICEESTSLFVNNATFRIGLEPNELRKLFSSYGAGRGKVVYEAWGTEMSLENLLVTDCDRGSILEKILLLANMMDIRFAYRFLKEFRKFNKCHGEFMRSTGFVFDEFRLAIFQKRKGLLTQV